MNRKTGAACIAAAFFLASAATAAEPTPQQMDAMHSAFGDHHSRAVHAKGTIVEGSFDPAARGLTAAALFSASTIPVTARFFSDFTGIPTILDNIGDANPRGFAVKFVALRRRPGYRLP